jgi:FRG domain
MATKRSGLNKEKLDSWQSFQRWVDDHSDSAWVFRGLGDIDFPLVPSIGRLRSYSVALEQSVQAAFLRRLPQFMSETSFSPWEIMAIAQHHGVPTRLLDWTTNPLVAAYFASCAQPMIRDMHMTDDPVRATPAHNSVDARIVAVRVTSKNIVNVVDVADPFDIAAPAFVLPKTVSTRIASQSGLFSIHPHPDKPWTEPLSKSDHIFDIQGRYRDFFLRRLFYLGVDPLYMMGGLDGLGARVSWQARRNIGLGAIV